MAAAAAKGVVERPRGREAQPPAGPTERDRKLAAAVHDHNTQKRDESLMAIHQAKRKESGESNERRPFDRETDLALRPGNAKKKGDLLSNATKFESRFARGSFL